MWKNIKLSQYYLKLMEHNGYEVFITDFKSIWCAYFPGQNYLKCLQNCNKGLEIAEDLLLEKGLKILTNPEEINRFVFIENDNMLIVDFIVMHNMIPVKLKIKMAEGSKEMYLQEITLPLLSTVQDLKSSENSLRRLLKAKDDEINEYRDIAGKVNLRCIRTKPFDESVHTSQHSVFDNTLGSTDFLKTLIQSIQTNVKLPDRNKYTVAPESTIKNQVHSESNIPKAKLVSETNEAIDLTQSDSKEENNSNPKTSFRSNCKRQKTLNI